LSAALPFPDASALVADALRDLPLIEHGRFLRELMAHTAAGLVASEGAVEAAEAVYRLADAVVDRAPSDGGWRDVVKLASGLGLDPAKVGRAIRRAERHGLGPAEFFAIGRDRLKRSVPVISFQREGETGFVCVTPKRIWREGGAGG
jgi:hypothetical protein